MGEGVPLDPDIMVVFLRNDVAGVGVSSCESSALEAFKIPSTGFGIDPLGSLSILLSVLWAFVSLPLGCVWCGLKPSRDGSNDCLEFRRPIAVRDEPGCLDVLVLVGGVTIGVVTRQSSLRSDDISNRRASNADVSTGGTIGCVEAGDVDDR